MNRRVIGSPFPEIHPLELLTVPGVSELFRSSFGGSSVLLRRTCGFGGRLCRRVDSRETLGFVPQPSLRGLLP
ncbi:MAG: hypothetical protein O7D94_13075, partial [Planctomycetota bacterium]|nr:hypothetical protein [Planctomycetota bacterium]